MVYGVSPTYLVEGASLKRLEAIPKLSAMAGVLYFETMVEHLELTGQGIPLWITPLEIHRELPIDAD